MLTGESAATIRYPDGCYAPAVVALYSYGYRNIYELAPQLDLPSTRLAFESSRPSN